MKTFILIIRAGRIHIKVGAYGEGDKPVISTSGNSAITITGSYLNINNISIKVNSNSTELACENNPKGEISGIRLEAGLPNNILQHIQISVHMPEYLLIITQIIILSVTILRK
jgi:hypothetical protein